MQFQNNKSNDEIPDDLKILMSFVDEFFGYKAINSRIIIDEKALEYILYDSFLLRFGLDERYGMFAVSIAMGNGYRGISKLLGERLSLNNDKKSIIESLKVIDKYCRLRLPDKFLSEFDKGVF